MTLVVVVANHSRMRWLLSIHVRRIIAVLLLLFDLTQEPGSALSFVGLEDTDGDAVAELCTKDNFWWGMASGCTVSEPTSAGRNTASSRGSPPVVESVPAERTFVKACCAITFTALAVVTEAAVPFETVLSELGLTRFGEPPLHRNVYAAQKRDIVLIV